MTGLLIWCLLLWLAFRARQWGLRQQEKHRHKRVSRNPVRRTATSGTGPKWEQDTPYPECFDEGDDL